MTGTARPGPAGDFDYEAAGIGYAVRRRADPRIAALVRAALGDARTVLNVGAGSGNYEPRDRSVVALEPSAAMRAQRPAGAAPCVIGTAAALPFDDTAFDACMACATVHQWPDLARGIAELRRVARATVAILTFDPRAYDDFWVADYAPERSAVEGARTPSVDRLVGLLGGTVEVRPVPIPRECSDGILEAFYARPEALLRPEIRAAQSIWTHLGAEVEQRFAERLAADLASGRWDARHGHWRGLPAYEGPLVLLVAHLDRDDHIG